VHRKQAGDRNDLISGVKNKMRLGTSVETIGVKRLGSPVVTHFNDRSTAPYIPRKSV